MPVNVSPLRAPTTPAHDVFEVMFQAADMVGSFWQPLLKSTGRWQLEMSHLAAKQTRAAIEATHKAARCGSPVALMQVYSDYWSEVGALVSDANRNIATALVRAAPHAAVLELPLTRPRPQHDTLYIPGAADERKVA